VILHFCIHSNFCQSYQGNPRKFEFKYNGLFKCLSIQDTEFLFKIADNVIILVEILDMEL